MGPSTFDSLILITNGTEFLHDLENGISQQIGRDVPAVVKLQWEKYLESPQGAAHTLFFPKRKI
jgi:hypothetical protein